MRETLGLERSGQCQAGAVAAVVVGKIDTRCTHACVVKADGRGHDRVVEHLCAADLSGRRAPHDVCARVRPTKLIEDVWSREYLATTERQHQLRVLDGLAD